jgi:hypothetical protein
MFHQRSIFFLEQDIKLLLLIGRVKTLINLHMKKTTLFLLVTLLMFISCGTRRNGDKDKLKQALSMWIGKEIYLPKDLEIKVREKDTICKDIFSKKFKVLTYVDSIGCTACKFKLFEWGEIIKKVLRNNRNVSFLFYVHSNDYDKLEKLMQINKFIYPIIYDKSDKLNRLNHLPDNLRFHTFLLDQNNKIVLVGNPVGNSKLLDLYLQQILK